jgi:hypothetical protein
VAHSYHKPTQKGGERAFICHAYHYVNYIHDLQTNIKIIKKSSSKQLLRAKSHLEWD